MTNGLENVADSVLQLEYEIWGSAPVQALGTVVGREFYFRSRHTKWTFEVATESGDFPTDIGGVAVFYRDGKYENASDMPLEEGIAIIKQLATEYATSGGQQT